MFFIGRPLLAATPYGNAEQLAQFSYSKLMPWTLGPFRFVSVTTHALTIDGNGIHNTVATNLTSTVPNRTQVSIATHFKAAEDSLATDIQENERSQPQSLNKYVFERIVGQNVNGANIRYTDR